jgi:hypothetical protein
MGAISMILTNFQGSARVSRAGCGVPLQQTFKKRGEANDVFLR